MAKNGDKVVVTTKHRGVFFGTLSKRNGDTITLKDCRNCLYWPKTVKGFLGLAVTGPLDGSRVGPAAIEVELFGVTSIDLCSDEAVKAWESEPWN